MFLDRASQALDAIDSGQRQVGRDLIPRRGRCESGRDAHEFGVVGRDQREPNLTPRRNAA